MAKFFLHVPKTGGQSFRKAAVQYFGKDNSLLLYGENSKTTTSVINSIYYGDIYSNHKEKLEAICNIIEQKSISFFSSHASAIMLPCFKEENAIIFLREPTQRIISHYNYAIKKGHITGTFEAFIENPIYQNMQSTILCGRDIKSIKFIGIMEFYKDSITLFNKTFNTSLKVYKENRMVFFSKKIKYSKLSEEEKEKIKYLNQKDYLLYYEALSLFQNRIK